VVRLVLKSMCKDTGSDRLHRASRYESEYVEYSWYVREAFGR